MICKLQIVKHETEVMKILLSIVKRMVGSAVIEGPCSPSQTERTVLVSAYTWRSRAYFKLLAKQNKRQPLFAKYISEGQVIDNRRIGVPNCGEEILIFEFGLFVYLVPTIVMYILYWNWLAVQNM